MAPEDVPDEDADEDVGLNPDDSPFDEWASLLDEAAG